MGKKYYLYACSILAMGIMLWSCLREPNSYSDRMNQADDFTVAYAQEFFENVAPEITIASQSPGDEIPLMPLWDYGKSFTIENTEIVQTPLNIIPSYIYEKNSPDSVYHNIIANSVTFLVMQRERGEKDVDFRVVRFVAEDDYLMDNPSKIFYFSLSYLSDYCGMIFNYDIQGNLLDGVVYRNGEQTGIIGPADWSGSATRGRVSSDRYYERFSVIPAIESRSEFEYDPKCPECRMLCYACMVHRMNAIEEIVVTAQRKFLCGIIQSGSSDGSGGGSGGSSGGHDDGSGGGLGLGGSGDDGTTNPPTNNKPFPNAKYASDKLPNKISPQEAGKKYCAIAIIAFLREFYGLPAKTQQQIANNYIATIYPLNYSNMSSSPRSPLISAKGIPTADIPEYMKNDFATVDSSTYKGAIDNGYLIMTDIQVGYSNLTHTILVIGYEQDNLVYYDPADGNQKKIAPSELDGSYAVIISGKK